MSYRNLGLIAIAVGIIITVINYETPSNTKSCDTMTADDYINSEYYNETHQSFNKAQSTCYDLGNQFKLESELIPFIGITCVGIGLFFYSIVKKENPITSGEDRK